MSAAAVECDSQELGVLEPTYTAVLWNPYRDSKILVVNRLMESESGRPEKWLKSVPKSSQTKSSPPKPRRLKKLRSNSQDPSSLHWLSTQAKILFVIKTQKLKQPSADVPNSPDLNAGCVIEDLRSPILDYFLFHI